MVLTANHFSRGTASEPKSRKAVMLLARPHVGPDEPARLVRRVGVDAHLVLEVALGRLGRHVDAGAGRVELPAVVDAAQTCLLVASEEERGAAVGTGLREETDVAVGVAEGYEVLAQDAYAHRRASGSGISDVSNAGVQ